jgi:hypothetical protein
MYQHKKNVVATRSDDHTPAVSSFFSFHKAVDSENAITKTTAAAP